MNLYSALGNNLCRALYSGTIPFAKPFFEYTHNVAKLPANLIKGCDAAMARSNGNGFSASAIGFLANDTKAPARLRGALVFGDFALKCLWAVPLGANGEPDMSQAMTLVRASSLAYS
jgi:hypothetical protein